MVITVTKQQAASQGFSGGRLKALCCNHVEIKGLIYFAPSLKNSDTVKISFTYWNNARLAGIKKEDRQAFHKAAAKKKWTPKQFTNLSSVRRLWFESDQR